jgi:hypothetical protein
VVGYGVTDGTAKVGAWHRRSADVAVRSVDAPLIHLGDSAAQTCFGDSGGPALATVAGALTIVGVTSFGDADCTNGGWDDRIDLEAQFLDGAIPAEDCPVCGGATPVCDHAAKACVGCVADGDCGAGSPRCNPLTHSCGVCATDADCPTGTPACSGTGQCVQCGEGNSALCTRDFPICDLKVGACVQCLADADCPAPTCDHPAAMACDGATHTCK